MESLEMATEKRLIDADAMREDWLENGENEYVYDTNAVLESIDAQPTIEATPVVHGRWLDNGICDHKPSRFRNPDKWTIYKCSECSYSNGRRKNANYCPNCGAKMDGEKDG